MSELRPYGLWPSPLSPKSLAGDKRLDGARFDSDGQTLVWLEGRSGRGVLVAQRLDDASAPRDLTSELSVRGEVGYGGGDFAVQGGYVYFVAHKTGRIFRQAIASGKAKPITPSDRQRRVADAVARRPLGRVCASRRRRQRSHRHRRRRGDALAANFRRRARLLHAATMEPRRQAVRVRRVGQPQHAVGRYDAVRRRRRRTPARLAAASRRAASRRWRRRRGDLSRRVLARWPHALRERRDRLGAARDSRFENEPAPLADA